jgi:hypothetical protein
VLGPPQPTPLTGPPPGRGSEDIRSFSKRAFVLPFFSKRHQRRAESVNSRVFSKEPFLFEKQSLIYWR